MCRKDSSHVAWTTVTKVTEVTEVTKVTKVTKVTVIPLFPYLFPTCRAFFGNRGQQSGDLDRQGLGLLGYPPVYDKI